MSQQEPINSFDLVVAGNSLPHLALALDCASVGLKVAVIQKEETELPEDYVADPECYLSEWIEFVARPLTETESPAFFTETKETEIPLVLKQGEWINVPEGAVLGIPVFPLQQEVIKGIGPTAALVSYLDRLKPVLTIGKTKNLADLITKRLGAKVLNTFVEPQAVFRFGKRSVDLDVSEVLPGLNEAVTRAGSLSGAALAFKEKYDLLTRQIMPHTGWEDFKRVLTDRLLAYGVEIVQVGEEMLQDDGALIPELAAQQVVHLVRETESPMRLETKILLDELTGFPDDPRAVGFATVLDEAGAEWAVRVSRVSNQAVATLPSPFQEDLQNYECKKAKEVLTRLSLKSAQQEIECKQITDDFSLGEAVDKARTQAVTIRRKLLNLTQN